MKIIKWLLLAVILTGFTYGQNLIYTTMTWANATTALEIDIGLDTELILQDYTGGNEIRLIGLWFDGTWTNTSVTVKASTTAGSYDAVKEADGTALTITMASNTWVWLEPRIFAGLRFIELSGSSEGGARTLVLIKRIY